MISAISISAIFRDINVRRAKVSAVVVGPFWKIHRNSCLGMAVHQMVKNYFRALRLSWGTHSEPPKGIQAALRKDIGIENTEENSWQGWAGKIDKRVGKSERGRGLSELGASFSLKDWVSKCAVCMAYFCQGLYLCNLPDMVLWSL